MSAVAGFVGCASRPQRNARTSQGVVRLRGIIQVVMGTLLVLYSFAFYEAYRSIASFDAEVRGQ